MPYDGHTLPLDDGACERIVVYDAFHHVPNQRQILAEMHRVLTADGVVAMAEPGQGHASTHVSIRESARPGVLENELVIEDLAALAEAVGFSTVNVMVAGDTTRYQIPARHIGRFKGGHGFRGYWRNLCREVGHHHYVFMYKGDAETTTARPDQLVAEIWIVRPTGTVTLRRGVRARSSTRPRWRCRVRCAGQSGHRRRRRPTRTGPRWRAG